MHRRLCIIGWLAVTVLTSGMAIVPCGAETEEIFTLAEVAPGMTGYGLSVFSGFEPERFDVEVIGVWRNLRPGTSYILARLTGMGLEDSGVVAGMSGSPIFLENRLAGAVAFSWPFSHEAVAGITPIESMRQMAVGGSEAPAPAGGASFPSINQLATGDLSQKLLDDGLSLLAARARGIGGSGVLWSTVGFGEQTRQLLSESLGSVAPAGQTTAVGPDLVPGASVAGVLVNGDLRLAATGTVTDRRGEEILAFGHPFLGLGAVQIPMATAEVVTVLSSQFQSFKAANVGEVVGAFDLDRMTGIRGRLGLEAPTLSLAISVRGDRQQDFQLRLADLPQVAPILVAISMLGSLEATTHAAGNQGLDLLAGFDLGDNGELTVRQSFDGQSAALEAAIHLFAYTGFILNNRLERVEIRAIKVELTQYSEPRTARLVEAYAAQTVVGPGDRVPLNFDLMAYRGDRFRRSLELEVPTGIPDGRYSLLVGDGVSVDVARLMIERSEPVNFRQALDFLRSLHSRRELVVLGVFGGPGLAVAGEVLPQLPPSMRSIWGAAASGSAVPLRLAVAQERVIELAVPVEGLLRIDLEVRRQGPLATDADEAPAGGESSDTTAPEKTSAKAAGGLN